MKARSTIRKWAVRAGLAAVIFVCIIQQLCAQPGWPEAYFKVRENQMWIVLSRNLPPAVADSFITKYNLRNIGFHGLVRSGNDDSLVSMGWKIVKEKQRYIISKPFISPEPTAYPTGKIIFTPVPTPEDWHVVGGNRTTYGFNKFKNGREFKRENGLVIFYLDGFLKAPRVRLAGNFTNWQHAAFPMTKTDDGWMVKVKLEPGQYYYKFIIGDGRWTTDPANELSENDGRGNENSVFFVPNKTFFLEGYEDAHKVFVTGTFNNWAPDKVPMKRVNGGWQNEVYIEEGTYDYNFLVDGKTVKPSQQSEQKIAIGKPHRFQLKGFTDARHVMLAGNFNAWRPDKLSMKKISDGWELPSVLGPGNYQYKFIVDGHWMTDPANASIVNDGKGNRNSFMVIGANFVFKLKGYDDARDVFLAGDFNNWSPQGLRMEREDDYWKGHVYLAKGKHLYYFIVDGKIIKDPANKDWESDGWAPAKSVIWIDPNDL